MYWPIGAPRIYAATSSSTSQKHIVEVDDDAESRETTEGSGSVVEDRGIDSEDRSEEDQEITSGLSTPVTPITPGIKPVEHDTQRRFSEKLLAHEAGSFKATDKQPLLALRMSRSGHLFAVITTTSLTIWQTKVCISIASPNPPDRYL